MKLFHRSPFPRPPASGPTVRVIPPPPPEAAAAFNRLVAPLPEFAREELTHSTLAVSPLPQDAPALFARMHSLLVGAGVAEGRGGYPGCRGRPGWPEYVKEQRRRIAVLKVMAEAWGWPSPSITESVRSYDESFPPDRRLLGDGYEPHVDDVAGRLIYSLPVDSGFVGTSFAFPIRQSDLDMLRADAWRRAVFQVVAHTVLQASMIRGAPEVTEVEFARLRDAALHSPANELARFVHAFGREHNLEVDYFARQAMQAWHPSS